MTDDAGQEYGVPLYRDTKRAARIVEARRCGDLYADIAAREGLTRQRIHQICRDAGVTGRIARSRLPRPCARTECGKLLRDPSAVYCSNDCAKSERAARRGERGMAEVREMVEHERRVLALHDALPKDRMISRDEAEQFLVELYRTGMSLGHIGKRTNCSYEYVKNVVRCPAPELLRPRERPTRKKPALGPLLDIGELRNTWRVERYRRLAGAPLRDSGPSLMMKRLRREARHCRFWADGFPPVLPTANGFSSRKGPPRRPSRNGERGQS